MKTKIFILAALLLGCTSSYAQSVRVNSDQLHGWIFNNGTIKIADKWKIFHDIQIRRADGFNNWQQLLLRTGLLYDVNKETTVGGGICFVQTHPYGDFPVKNTFPEIRSWEQLQTSQSFGKATLTHRYRLEQRWIGNAAAGTLTPTRFENRVRYMAKLKFPIVQLGKKEIYGAVYDEVFLNFGKNVGRNVFDQNRLSYCFGVPLTKSINLEAGYVYQLIELRGVNVVGQNMIENNHTILLGLTSKF